MEQIEEPRVDRRSFLRVAGLGAGAIAAGGALDLATAVPARAAPGDGASFLGTDPDLHLLRRATYGPTQAGVREIRRLGRDRWLERQLDPASLDDAACEDLLGRRFPGLDWSIDEARANLEAFSWDLMFDLGVAALARATWSERQLLEVMVDFWSNHLNVTNPFDGGWDNRHDYDRRVIRAHALGRFEDMLLASAQHPAMLHYLNNAESSKQNPNENYGREVLELHTVGVDGGYDEEDMRDSTLVLTGLTVDWETGRFRFRPSWHHTGPVSVMGWSHPNANADRGLEVACAYLRYLANHPSTATRIAFKLGQRFVADVPPPALVDSLAQTYLANGTAIVPVLRKLFRSDAFAESIGQRVRRPMQHVVATLRTLGTQPGRDREALKGLYWFVEGLGDTPMGWHPPNGYPDVNGAWASAGGTLGRWNATMSLAADWWPDLDRPKLRSLLPPTLPATHGAMVDALAKRLVHRKLPPAHRDAVLGFLGKNADAPLSEGSEAVTWRLPYVVALILSSPSHALR
jgi:uncharacterized protein (DUF1800 family)